jgi:two-component system sensor histidine kinase KdpD
VNLLDNALKYTPAASPIEFRARSEGDALEVEVADRGPGLPAETLPRVFEKFFRGAHPGVGGVGLGLPICRGIVQAHGGTIGVVNREGGGASFRIRLPRLDPPPGPLTEEDDAPLGKEPTA